MHITPQMLVWLLSRDSAYRSNPDLCDPSFRNVTYSSGQLKEDPDPGAKAASAAAGLRIRRFRPGSPLTKKDAYTLYVVGETCDDVFFDDAFEEMKNLKDDPYATCLFLSAGTDAEEITEALQDVHASLLLWEKTFAEGILAGKAPEELLASLTQVLPLDFCVSDIDMNLLYCTEGYNRSRNLTPDHHFPADVFQDLISHTEFHEVAAKRELFYYYTAATDTVSYCSNLLADDEYIGRLVILLPQGESRLPVGAEQVCALCAKCVQDLFDHHSLLPGRHSNDQMHQLCRSLVSEDRSADSAIEAVLQDYGWRRDDRYSATVLHFTTDPGWTAHLSLTLPYLAMDLERNWSNSCTVCFDSEILLLVNHSRAAVDEDQHTFLQRIAYFVRDNICKAGVSPVFTDLSQLRHARKAADAALRIGMVRQPHFWYYLFDELRLPYLLESAMQLPVSMLLHPAIHQLMDYDQVHDTEFARTLQAYLTANLNMTEAAANLYIHRTSFCRRMNHIREITRLDLSDPDTILTLQISYRMLEMI